LKVAFDWGELSVAPPSTNTSQYTGNDYMSVRWSGLFKPELSETYTFFVSADNGVRIYVDGVTNVDQWEVEVGGALCNYILWIERILAYIYLSLHHVFLQANTIQLLLLQLASCTNLPLSTDM
jgi:hypothetical protein